MSNNRNKDLGLEAYRAAQAELAAMGIDLYTASRSAAKRDLAEQKRLRELYEAGKGNLAAKPNPNAPHVSGRALDLRARGRGISSPNDPQVRQVLEKHGFRRTVFKSNAGQDEPWHFEYFPDVTPNHFEKGGKRPTVPSLPPVPGAGQAPEPPSLFAGMTPAPAEAPGFDPREFVVQRALTGAGGDLGRQLAFGILGEQQAQPGARLAARAGDARPRPHPAGH